MKKEGNPKGQPTAEEVAQACEEADAKLIELLERDPDGDTAG